MQNNTIGGRDCQPSGSVLHVTDPWPAISMWSWKMLMAAKAFDSSGAAVMQQPVRLSAGGEGPKAAA